MKKNFSNLKLITALVILIVVVFGCNKIKSLATGGNKLYFCERYDPVKGEINESKKFTTGTLTVMVDLRPESQKIGVTDVNINITDKETGKVIETSPYTVKPDMDYIFFNNVKFDKVGKYHVSCLKPDGTVIVSGEVEIVEK